jgi:isopentenyl phosphate kinase
MILIKLGGSIITNKEKPLSPRKKTIENLAKNLKKIDEPMIIVHGGGSYGHYWSVKYDMHTKPRKYSGLIPVTFGDALWYGQNKTYILSGDKIMTHLSKILKPRLSIFALNEDGLYSDLKTKKLIYELKGEKPTISENTRDVTGGMSRKVEEASKIAKMGINVFFVNGNKPERIVNAVKNKKFEGTLFRGKRNA